MLPLPPPDLPSTSRQSVSGNFWTPIFGPRFWTPFWTPFSASKGGLGAQKPSKSCVLLSTFMILPFSARIAFGPRFGPHFGPPLGSALGPKIGAFAPGSHPLADQLALGAPRSLQEASKASPGPHLGLPGPLLETPRRQKGPPGHLQETAQRTPKSLWSHIPKSPWPSIPRPGGMRVSD